MVLGGGVHSSDLGVTLTRISNPTVLQGSARGLQTVITPPLHYLFMPDPMHQKDGKVTKQNITYMLL